MNAIVLALNVFWTTFSLYSAIIISGVVSDVFFLLEYSTTSSSSLWNVIFENADNHLGNEANAA